jgi:Xaa-Pro dipeptidase
LSWRSVKGRRAKVERIEYVLHPKSEIDARVARLQGLMGDAAGAILFQSIDMGYFTGTAQDGLVYIPRDDEPVVMVRKSLQRAIQESPLEVRRLKSLRTLKADLGIPSDSVIGLELDILPYNIYLKVANALNDVRLMDISDEIKQIRSVKSDFEIGLIKRAARIVDAGLGSIPDYLKENMREIELAARVEAVMREMGHQGMAHFRRFNQVIPMGHLMAGPEAAVPSFVSSPTGGKGVSLFHPQGPGFARIRMNEPLLADFAGVYNGYIADETRIFSLGKLPKWLEDAHIAALEIEKAIAKELRPGSNGRDLFSISETKGEQLGYSDCLGGPPDGKAGFVGHGVGLEIDEYPVLGPVDNPIKENMTIAVEPKMIYPGAGVVGIEDTFLTTAKEAQRLTMLPQEIWHV